MPGILSGFAAPLRLVTIDRAEGRPARAGRGSAPGCPASAAPTSARCPGTTSLYFSAVVSLPFVPGHEVVGRAARRLRGPAGRHPRRPRPGADLRGPRRRAVRRAARPAHTNRCDADHRRPPRARSADRLLHGHRRRLGPAARRPPQPAARGARGLSDEQAVLIEPLACAVHTALRAGVSRQRPGAGQRRRLGRAVRHARAAPAHPGRRDHRGRQARPPARAGAARSARPRWSRPARCCGGVRRVDRRLPAQAGVLRAVPARRRRRRDRRGRQQAVARDRAARHPRRRPGGALRDAGARPTCRAAWFRELEVVGTYASAQPEADGRGAFDIAAELAGSSPSYAAVQVRRQLSAAPLARGARPRPRGRPARYGQGRLRPKEQLR